MLLSAPASSTGNDPALPAVSSTPLHVFLVLDDKVLKIVESQATVLDKAKKDKRRECGWDLNE